MKSKSPILFMACCLIIFGAFYTDRCWAQGSVESAETQSDISVKVIESKLPSLSATDVSLMLSVEVSNLSDHVATYLDTSYYHGIFLYSVNQQGDKTAIFPFDPLKVRGGMSRVIEEGIPAHGKAPIEIKVPLALLDHRTHGKYQVSIVGVFHDSTRGQERRMKVFSQLFELPGLTP